LGLRRINDLLALPRPALASRFEKLVLRRLDQALGLQPEAIVQRRPATLHFVRRDFAEPLMVPRGVSTVIARLLVRLCGMLARDGAGVRRLTLHAYRIDGTTESVAIGTSEPVRDPFHLAKLCGPALEHMDPDPGIETLLVAAPVVEPFAPAQRTLPRIGATQASVQKGVAAMIDSLVVRLGPANVTYCFPQHSHLPERQFRARSALAAGPPDWSAWPASLPSVPLRLFPVPQTVNLELNSPEGAPRTFAWQGQVFRAARAEGPDRRLGAWWTGDGAARDYYLVEENAGRRLWLYRDHADARWRVHGILG
jgi:protein ImuB